MVELWGGFECTLNRIDNRFRDQLLQNERSARIDCLNQLSDLGVTSFRYRIAWDEDTTSRDTFAADIALLERIGISPIIGLLHHGSGPASTDLLSQNFARGLADHARDVAQRFPNVMFWTPVNEPLTTARFSALYGHWYPHARSERLFWLALLNQIDATRMAMREIRQINPAAQLVQTEDLGRSFGTAALRDQIAFDNQRRWMTWDLLTGRVVPGHPLFDRLCAYGYRDRLKSIADDPCPPDIVGVDHYLTSDRFLDHRVARYPPQTHGGNGTRRYADVEAVRVLSTPRESIADTLREAWNRYRIPVALTECHNGCTREEQMRWFLEAWTAAGRLVREGCDIRAVTSWALLGARDWSNLATESGDVFECGAFDPRGGDARPTAAAALMKALTQDAQIHPAAGSDGWWRRASRTQHRPSATAAPVPRARPHTHVAPILIAGASGTLGQALFRAARARGLHAVALDRRQLPLDDERSIDAVLQQYRPWAMINATGWVRVDDAETEPDGCMRSNVDAALALGRVCDARGVQHVYFSSDLVFDGARDGPYVETDPSAPLSVYGRSKAVADQQLLQFKTAIVVRTAAFFSPFDRHNFAFSALAALRQGHVFRASAQHRISPTYVPHLADFVLDLTIDRETGLWHASNGVELSWFDFARKIAEACDFDPDRVEAVDPDELGWIAARPARCGLATIKGQRLPLLPNAIADFAGHTRAHDRVASRAARQIA